jgi:hypothetical protein
MAFSPFVRLRMGRATAFSRRRGGMAKLDYATNKVEGGEKVEPSCTREASPAPAGLF